MPGPAGGGVQLSVPGEAVRPADGSLVRGPDHDGGIPVGPLHAGGDEPFVRHPAEAGVPGQRGAGPGGLHTGDTALRGEAAGRTA